MIWRLPVSADVCVRLRVFANFASAMSLDMSLDATRSRENLVDHQRRLLRRIPSAAFARGIKRTLTANKHGGRVEGTDDAAVQMSIRMEIRAATRDDVAEAQGDVGLDFRDNAPRVEATVTDRRADSLHARSRGR